MLLCALMCSEQVGRVLCCAVEGYELYLSLNMCVCCHNDCAGVRTVWLLVTHTQASGGVGAVLDQGVYEHWSWRSGVEGL